MLLLNIRKHVFPVTVVIRQRNVVDVRQALTCGAKTPDEIHRDKLRGFLQTDVHHIPDRTKTGEPGAGQPHTIFNFFAVEQGNFQMPGRYHEAINGNMAGRAVLRSPFHINTIECGAFCAANNPGKRFLRNNISP